MSEGPQPCEESAGGRQRGPQPREESAGDGQAASAAAPAAASPVPQSIPQPFPGCPGIRSSQLFKTLGRVGYRLLSEPIDCVVDV